MSEYRQCTRCVMDNVGDDKISFRDDGTCNYCNEALGFQSLRYWPNEKGQKKLDAIVDKMKENCKNDRYDCIVGISGGLDSSYIVYLGHLYGLRMLGVHVDDGLDTDIAKKNIYNLCKRAGMELINLKPDAPQYRDLTLSFLKAAVPNLAIPQDNLILAGLQDVAKKNKIKYILHGDNFSMECILQDDISYTPMDTIHINAIQKQFSEKSISKLHLINTFENSILKRLRKDLIRIKPLNYIDYNLEKALSNLKTFSDYDYYGGKHHESVLTRFLQCYYLPVKFGVDKRKSHLSSLVVTGQMTREEALERLKQPAYISNEMKESDFNFLSEFLGISRQEFESIVALPPKSHDDYKKSFLSNRLVPWFLEHRKIFKI